MLPAARKKEERTRTLKPKHPTARIDAEQITALLNRLADRPKFHGLFALITQICLDAKRIADANPERVFYAVDCALEGSEKFVTDRSTTPKEIKAIIGGRADQVADPYEVLCQVAKFLSDDSPDH